jgi:hypothetical protein
MCVSHSMEQVFLFFLALLLCSFSSSAPPWSMVVEEVIGHRDVKYIKKKVVLFCFVLFCRANCVHSINNQASESLSFKEPKVERHSPSHSYLHARTTDSRSVLVLMTYCDVIVMCSRPKSCFGVAFSAFTSAWNFAEKFMARV